MGRYGLLLITALIATAQLRPPATFRVGTELVQVSVVAQDKQGKPVTDLRREEFQILDNGARQEIGLFIAENPTVPEPAVPNVFTNQAPPGGRGGYAVILIDNLLTNFGDIGEAGAAIAVDRTLLVLQSIPMGASVAIYALQKKLRVVCEFTPDRDLLERQLRTFKLGVDTPTTAIEILGDGSQPGDASQEARAELSRQDMLRRSVTSSGELAGIAGHLAAIPGRKNLIWLADRFVIDGPALQKLSDANVAVYPVALNARSDMMDRIAAFTGGIAYSGGNTLDIPADIREAMDDGRVSYTLGFYQPGEDCAARIHQLTVQTSRPGVVLRYRASYFSQCAPAQSGNPAAAAVEAATRPVDASAIPIKAVVTRVQDRLNLEATLDVGSLDLIDTQGRWKGKVEAVARFATADGRQAGDVISQTLTMNLRQATYDLVLQHGVTYHNLLRVPPSATELKLLFTNLASGKTGTLTIPLSRILQARVVPRK